AAGFTDPGAGARTGGTDVWSEGASGVTPHNNLIGFAAGYGVFLNNNSQNWLIQDNEIRGNGQVSNWEDGIFLNPGPGMTVRGNLIAGNVGNGVDLRGSGAIVLDNTITGNGTYPYTENAGVQLGFATGNLIS